MFSIVDVSINFPLLSTSEKDDALVSSAQLTFTLFSELKDVNTPFKISFVSIAAFDGDWKTVLYSSHSY